jgi:hypothetical protein
MKWDGAMPSVIILKDQNETPLRDLCFLIKEEDFPIEAVQLIQNQVKQFISDEKKYTEEELIAIVEEITAEYSGTLIPFKLYFVSY